MKRVPGEKKTGCDYELKEGMPFRKAGKGGCNIRRRGEKCKK